MYKLKKITVLQLKEQEVVFIQKKQHNRRAQQQNKRARHSHSEI